MDAVISKLLSRFEQGRLTRRELTQGLTMLTAASGSAVAQGGGLRSARIDHVSIQVSDLSRSLAFYQKVFGIRILSEDKPNEIVRLGTSKVLVSLHHKNPTAVVDHFAIGVDNFSKDAVTRELKQQGITLAENLDAGFHIKDPEGISVQIVGA